MTSDTSTGPPHARHLTPRCGEPSGTLGCSEVTFKILASPLSGALDIRPDTHTLEGGLLE